MVNNIRKSHPVHGLDYGGKVTQTEAAEILRVSSPRESDVTSGKIEKFTIDALVDMVEKTGHHVRLEVA
jgi:predicted XRE-type DNA-binding protein